MAADNSQSVGRSEWMADRLYGRGDRVVYVVSAHPRARHIMGGRRDRTLCNAVRSMRGAGPEHEHLPVCRTCEWAAANIAAVVDGR